MNVERNRTTPFAISLEALEKLGLLVNLAADGHVTITGQNGESIGGTTESLWDWLRGQDYDSPATAIVHDPKLVKMRVVK